MDPGSALAGRNQEGTMRFLCLETFLCLLLSPEKHRGSVCVCVPTRAHGASTHIKCSWENKPQSQHLANWSFLSAPSPLGLIQCFLSRAIELEAVFIFFLRSEEC